MVILICKVLKCGYVEGWTTLTSEKNGKLSIQSNKQQEIGGKEEEDGKFDWSRFEEGLLTEINNRRKDCIEEVKRTRTWYAKPDSGAKLYS